MKVRRRVGRKKLLWNIKHWTKLITVENMIQNWANVFISINEYVAEEEKR